MTIHEQLTEAERRNVPQAWQLKGWAALVHFAAPDVAARVYRACRAAGYSAMSAVLAARELDPDASEAGILRALASGRAGR